MKSTIRVLALALAVVLMSTVVSGDRLLAQTIPSPSQTDPRMVTVTGEADVRVVPDEVVLSVGIETSDRDLTVAKRENDEIVRRVLALADEYEIPSNLVQTDYVSIEPRYRDSYEQRDFIGYFVRKSIMLTLRDVSAFEALLTDVLEAGVTYVHGIEFHTTELRKHRDQARSLAIRAAQEKAIALATELDQAVGQPHDIREEYSGWWSSYNAWWGSRSGSAMMQNVIQESTGAAIMSEGTLAPGQISVVARVSVSFELQ